MIVMKKKMIFLISMMLLLFMTFYISAPYVHGLKVGKSLIGAIDDYKSVNDSLPGILSKVGKYKIKNHAWSDDFNNLENHVSSMGNGSYLYYIDVVWLNYEIMGDCYYVTIPIGFDNGITYVSETQKWHNKVIPLN